MAKIVFIPISTAARQLGVAQTRIWALIRNKDRKKRVRSRTTKDVGVEIDATALSLFVKNNPSDVDMWRQMYADNQRRQRV